MKQRVINALWKKWQRFSDQGHTPVIFKLVLKNGKARPASYNIQRPEAPELEFDEMMQASEALTQQSAVQRIWLPTPDTETDEAEVVAKETGKEKVDPIRKTSQKVVKVCMAYLSKGTC